MQNPEKILTAINEEQENILNVTGEEQESVLDATDDESEEWGTFAELRQILIGPEIKLYKNYRSTGSGGSSDEIVIDRQITIDGNGHTIDCARKSTAFVLAHSNVVLKNMRITGFADTSMSHLYAVTVKYDTWNCRIENCIFEGNSYSVLSVRGQKTVVSNCIFRNNSANEAEIVYLGNSGYDINRMVGCTFVDNGKITSDGKFDTDKVVSLGSDFLVESCHFENNTAKIGIIHFGDAHYYSTVNKCFFGAAETYKDYGLIYGHGRVSESIFCTPDIKGNVMNGVIRLDYNLWFDGTKSYEIPERVVEGAFGYGDRYAPYIVTGYEVVKKYELIFLIDTYYVPLIPKEVRLGDTIQLKLMFLKANTSLLQMPQQKSVTFQVVFSDSNLNPTNITFTNGISTPFNYTALDGEEGTATILYNGEIITSIKLKHAGEYDSFTLLKHAISKASNEIDLTHDYKFYSSLDDKNAFTVDKDITINGNGHTIDGCNGANGIFNFAGGRNITVKDLNFINFKGLVVNGESSGNDQIAFINCTFKNIGGGIKSNKITMISDCKFEDSTATAINLYSTQNTANIIDNSIFENCKSKYDGGAGYINSTTIITDSQFKNNYARNGGGLYIDAQNCAVDNCSFIGNEADYLAGGIYFNNNECNLTRSLFENNSAASNVPFYFITTQGTVENNTETNNTISKNSFSDLKGIIDNGGNVINLEIDYKYKYSSKTDRQIADGIPIEKNLIVNGNGHTLDGDAYATFFEIDGKTIEVTFNNINFVNALAFATYIKSAKSVSFNNCTFQSNVGQENDDAVIYIKYQSGAYSVTDSVLINRCSFIYNDFYNIILANSGAYELTIKDSVFVNPNATYDLNINSHNSHNYLDYNWWGNSEGNFSSMPKVNNAQLNNWYFPTTAVKSNMATVSLNNLYDNVAKTVAEDTNCSLADVPVEFIGKDIIIDDAVIKDGILTAPYKTIKKPAFLTTVIYGINNTVNITEKGQFDQLQELIDNATSNIVTLNQDYTLTEDIDSVGGIIINKDNLIINGNGHTINALGISNLFNILSDNVILMNMTLINGNGTISQSSPIQWSGNYGTMENCTVSNNFAERFGTITWTGTMGSIINSIFNNNRGLSSGGAIYIEGISVSVVNSNFTGNVAFRGAAVYSNKEYTYIDNCTFIKNDANYGGAVYLNEEHGKIRYCRFENNTGRYGGAVYCNDVNDAVTISIFTFNNARDGGAVYWNKKYGLLEDCEFANNTATEDGGAVYWNANYGTVDSSSFENNTAERGGAIYWDYDYGKLIESTFIKNTANDGGAIYFCEGNLIKNEQQTVDYSTFLENSAQNNGGAIYIAAKKSSIGNSTFIKNQAQNGGALYATFEDGTISQSAFINNSASNEGSAIYTDEDSTPVNYCTFFEDNAKPAIYYDQSWYVFGKLNADYNWWGNNITNSNQKFANANNKVEINNWYVLNMTMNEGIANITLNNLFENNKIGTDGNCKMAPINITLTNENLTVPSSVILGENGYVEVEYIPKAIKGSLKASFETASITKSEDFLPSSITITTAEDEFTYENITFEYEAINPTITNLTITNGNGDIVFEDLTLAYVISPDLAAGTYTITVTNIGNGSIVPSNDTKTFTVNKATPTITVVTEDVTYPDDVVVNVTSDVAGNYTVKIENNVEKINLTANEVKQLIFSSLKAQEYIVNVTYDETENYTFTVNDIVKVTVKKATPTITVTADNVVYPDNVTVNVESDVNGTYAVKLGDIIQNVDIVANETQNILFTGVNASEYEITVTFDGNENYNNITKNTTVKVSKANSYVKINSIIDGIYNTIAPAIDVTIKNKTTAIYTITKNSEIIKSGDYNDLNNTLTTLSIGEYTITITNEEDTNYNASNDTGNFKIAKADAKITINSDADNTTTADYIYVVYGDKSGEIVATLTNPHGKGLVTANVVVTLDGVDYALKTNSKGQVKVSTANLTTGIYTTTVSYAGNSKYNPTNETATVIVNKQDTQISAVYDANSNELMATLTNAEGKELVTANVIVNLNNTDYSLKTNSKGQVKISTADLSSSYYNVTAFYKGNSKYNPSNITVEIFVKKSALLSAPNASVVYEDESGQFIATLTNDEGKALTSANVIVNLNGVEYALKTNSKGQVKISTANLTIGKHTAKVTYKGNAKYKPATATATIVVTKKDAVISVDYDSGAHELVATLTNSITGKALTGANVVVSIDGVDYALKTNSKGQVKISTANLTIGKHTATVSYAGNSKYNPAYATIDIDIKTDVIISDIYDDSNELTATLTNADTGKAVSGANVKVNINGVTTTVKTNSKGKIKVSTADLNMTNYTAHISYAGNSKYNPASATAKIDLNKTNVVLTADFDADNLELTAVLTNSNTGKAVSGANVAVNLNGTSTTITSNSKGQVIMPIDDLDSGIYVAVISYKGNSKYNPISTTAIVEF